MTFAAFEGPCPVCHRDGTMPEINDKAVQRMVHDFPFLQQFHTKHALGPMLPPSCLVCGHQTHPITRPVAIQHAELPGIVVCQQCRDAALTHNAALTGATAQPARPVE